VIAFLTGAASLYSSTSGVVLPALLPTVPGLAERLGGADALGIASSINVGGTSWTCRRSRPLARCARRRACHRRQPRIVQ